MFWIGLFLAGVLLSLTDAAPVATAIFPVPVAVLWARGRHGAAAAAAVCGAVSVLVGQLLAAAALAAPGTGAMMGAGALILAAAALAVGGLGAPLGEMIRRGRPFGQCVALMTAAMYALVVLETALLWADSRKAWTIAINQRIAQIEFEHGQAADIAHHGAVGARFNFSRMRQP